MNIRAITDNRPLCVLVLIDGKEEYAGMYTKEAQDHLRKCRMDKQGYFITIGDEVIRYTNISKILHASGLDYFRVFILDKLPIQERLDFQYIEREARRIDARPTLETILYKMEEAKKERAYFQEIGRKISDAEKQRRRKTIQAMNERVAKIFKK